MSATASRTAVPTALDAEALLDVRMRLSVELGRVRMPVARAVGLGSGSIVDLDRRPDDAVEIYVNGVHYGSGRLLLSDGEWALRIEAIVGRDQVVEQASIDGSAGEPPTD